MQIAVRSSSRGEARTQDGDLRRARRRPGNHRVLREAQAELRVLLALSRSGRSPRRGAGGSQSRNELLAKK
jgi:hypothetical protein